MNKTGLPLSDYERMEAEDKIEKLRQETKELNITYTEAFMPKFPRFTTFSELMLFEHDYAAEQSKQEDIKKARELYKKIAKLEDILRRSDEAETEARGPLRVTPKPGKFKVRYMRKKSKIVIMDHYGKYASPLKISKRDLDRKRLVCEIVFKKNGDPKTAKTRIDENSKKNKDLVKDHYKNNPNSENRAADILAASGVDHINQRFNTFLGQRLIDIIEESGNIYFQINPNIYK